MSPLGAAPASANAIVDENLLIGTPQSQWDLHNADGSPLIEGFATEISVNHGSTVNFKITASMSSWRIDIYRLGYYQGNGARLITTINKTSSSPQPTPLRDAATGLVDAGNWGVTASWAIPASAVSGVYIARVVDNTNALNESHIPFIVRADESNSDIVFQTADTTWQAYNGWPCGTTFPNANLYGGNGPGGDSAPGRAYKVSYNRPITTRDGCGSAADSPDFLFGAEFAAIYWLEKNGYDVTYIAGADVARAPALLTHHKVFTSTGHDEYWDTTARANIENARGAGLHLMFMSGNEVYWKTRWEPSIDGSATAYRTLVCYKETRHNSPLDPLDASPSWMWTGTWRDPRQSPPADGGKPENALTGTIFQVDSYRADAIEVPYEMSRLRFWRNTPHVSHAANGVTTTLTQNILGYEWDIAPDNGYAPPGIIALSSTTLNVGTLLLNYGSMTGSGAATHKLTLYKNQTSGSIVFGAGTVFWSWGLSDNHDGPTTPTDPDIQQATVNILADMGVQPTTLESGLTAATPSTDVTAPTATLSFPANGASFVEGQLVTLTGAASDVGGIVAGVEVSMDGGVTTRQATGGANWSYTWAATPGVHTLMVRAVDDSLNLGAFSSQITVNVSSSGATFFGNVTVPSASTAEDRNAVELGVKFSAATSGAIKGVRFYKDWINSGPHVANLWGPGGNLLASAPFVAETPRGWQTVLFPAPVQITAGTVYTASYHTNGFYSAADSYFTAPLTSGDLTTPANAGVYQYGETSSFPSQTFRSGNYWVDVLFAPTPISDPPVINSDLTASGSVGSPFSYQITATNNPTSFSATNLPSGLSINASTGLISGTPDTAGATSVTIGATNANGTGQATLALNITTSVASSFSLFSLSSVPAIVTVADGSSVELGVKFVASGNGTINGIRFFKGPQNVGTHTAHLWSGSGTLLTSATFSGETTSGWQTVTFPAVNISAGQTYVASYHTNGYYSATGAFFSSAYSNPPFSAPAGANGVYAYGGGVVFPASSYNSTNYWVDVLFSPTQITSPPVIDSPSTANGVVGAPFSYQITASNSPTSYGAAGLPDGLSINASTGVISGTPTAAGASTITLTATNQNGSGTATLSLTVSAAPTTFSLFSPSSTPAIVTVNDSNSVELGVKFVPASDGSITGIRFYKGPQNIGAHTAHLWNSAGVLLASATFAGETASGWQSVSFPAVPVLAGQTYTASYHANGFYSASGAFFGSPVVNGPLTAPAGSNGVYAYGSSVSFPANSYNSTNYWVDVVFQ